MMCRLLALVLLPLFLLVILPPTATGENGVTTSTYKVITSFPHDPDAFTQGLVLDNGLLYEGTGRYGFSSLRLVDMRTGKVIREHRLPGAYFGEGITVFGDRIIQLTWQSRFGFVYDKQDFTLLRVFTYPFEGWGITQDGSQLITSDGTATIRFLDPESFDVKRRIEVMDENGLVDQLNELEYVNGAIYANVWRSDRIAIIDPENGRVTGWLDLSGLLGKDGADRPVDVLNGIAHDPVKDSLLVTGKLWPRLFEIQSVLLDEN